MIKALTQTQLNSLKDLILSEVNVKELEMVLVNTGETSVFEKLAKPNFRLLGPKFGKNLKVATGLISKLTQDQIAELESGSEIQDENNRVLKIISPNQQITYNTLNENIIQKEVNLFMVPEAQIGDYLLVHVGVAISVVDEEEARLTFKYLKDMGEVEELESPSI